jgi:agmatine deiminase
MKLHMPAEWEQHERTWMAWPSAGYAVGDGEQDADAAYQAWANVANAVVNFEPVTMVVDPQSKESASKWLDPRIEIHYADLDDAWMRDIGPTFVRTSDDDVVGINWVFNGWGAQHWAKWDHDSAIAEKILDHLNLPRIDSTLTNEGGGIHVNGRDTVLVTKTVQLDPGRNPELSATEVEVELKRTLGVSQVIWLNQGLTRDYDEFGTRGHVDIVATFCDADTLLFHDQTNPEHPDYLVSQEVREILGKTNFKLIPVPAPKVLKDDEGWVDYSYINHYVCNGAVILCSFDDPNDKVAKSIIEKAYPAREVVLVDAREIFARGGGIHCITQQQPK